MKFILLLLLSAFQLSLQAQYYYNDIIGTRETNRQMKAYVENKVKTVSATGYEPSGSKSTGFSEYQEVRANGRELKLSNITNLARTVTYSRFDVQGRIISITDSSLAVQNSTTYEYDEAGRLTKIQNAVLDSANAFNHTEIHNWYYNAAGQPTNMWRIIQNSGAMNNTDSLEVRFTTDENGNIADERTFKKNKETSYLYYYYDSNNNLSDIVRYNTKLKRLMPDLMFEYDDNGRAIQKITTTSSQQMGYMIWRYIFDSKGLKTKEALFNNDKEITGKIEYSYSFGQ
jgi:YD repeat-containing protein